MLETVKPLFNEYQVNNEDGQRIDSEFDRLVRPLVTEARVKGYDLRQLHALLAQSLGCIISEECLHYGMLRKQVEREERP